MRTYPPMTHSSPVLERLVRQLRDAERRTTFVHLLSRIQELRVAPAMLTFDRALIFARA